MNEFDMTSNSFELHRLWNLLLSLTCWKVNRCVSRFVVGKVYASWFLQSRQSAISFFVTLPSTLQNPKYFHTPLFRCFCVVIVCSGRGCLLVSSILYQNNITSLAYFTKKSRGRAIGQTDSDIPLLSAASDGLKRFQTKF